MTANNTTYRGHGLTLNIPDNIISLWVSYQQTKIKDTEQFGVIIGFSSEDKKTYWIESATTPLPNDKSGRTYFEISDKGYEAAVKDAYINSCSTSIFLGTWHTHPESIPTPSTIDKKDWKKSSKQNLDRQLFFVIVGTRQTHVFIRRKLGLGFGQLKRIETNYELG